jgi:hypothetical protein
LNERDEKSGVLKFKNQLAWAVEYNSKKKTGVQPEKGMRCFLQNLTSCFPAALDL